VSESKGLFFIFIAALVALIAGLYWFRDREAEKDGGLNILDWTPPQPKSPWDKMREDQERNGIYQQPPPPPSETTMNAYPASAPADKSTPIYTPPLEPEPTYTPPEPTYTPPEPTYTPPPERPPDVEPIYTPTPPPPPPPPPVEPTYTPPAPEPIIYPPPSPADTTPPIGPGEGWGGGGAGANGEPAPTNIGPGAGWGGGGAPAPTPTYPPTSPVDTAPYSLAQNME
jgi:cell division protein FtsN